MCSPHNARPRCMCVYQSSVRFYNRRCLIMGLRRQLPHIALLLAILLAGGALRFYRVGELPPGLYRDEAYYGLDALRILAGEFALYFAANNGREGLFMYALAAGVALLGRTPEALRATSAAIGVLTIAAIYFTGRQMFSPRVGLLSAAILAVNFWHLALSRVAFRAITLPAILCLAVALAFAALRAQSAGRRALAAGLAGATFGLTLYTYTSAQLVAILVAWGGLLAWASIARSGAERAAAWRWTALAFAFGLLLGLAPLAAWLTRHAELYFARAGQVSIFNPAISGGDPLGALVMNSIKAAGMFLFQGDRIWRHNLAWRPVFDGWLGVAFVLGLATCAYHLWKQRGESQTIAERIGPPFALGWLVVMLVPTVLAEDAPHFLRAVGALPAACLLAALGLEQGLAWLSRRGMLLGLAGLLRYKISPPAFLATLVLLISAFNTTNDYFNDYVQRDFTRYWLEDHNVQLARVINTHAAGQACCPPLPATRIWLQDRLAEDNPALWFLAAERWTRVSAGYQVSPALNDRAELPVLLIVDPNHPWEALRARLPAPARLRVLKGPLAQGDNDPAARRAFIAVRAEPLIDAEQALASFEGKVTLLTAEAQPIDADSQRYAVTLIWSADQPIGEDLGIFVHWLRGEPQPIAQADGSPASGYLPMPSWRVGDQIVDEHIVQLPSRAQAGDVVRVGIYRREDNYRLRVRDTGDDSVIITISQ
jgi:4-amino-4-deoxy-L-arabinose transferase-like glycosyltransferase